MRKLVLFSFFLASATQAVSAEIPAHLIQHADSAERQLTKNHRDLSDYLSLAAKTEEEKILVFSYWIAKNIRYDLNEARRINRSDKTANEVLSNRRAVCEGYSNLFHQLCKNEGIRCYTINGKSYAGIVRRTFSRVDMRHAWNAVYVNNEWKLVDVTWCEQLVKAPGFKKIRELEWIFTPPAEFSKSHLPNDPRWQMLQHHYATEEFWKKKEPVAKDYAFGDSLAVLLTRDSTENEKIMLRSAWIFSGDGEQYMTDLIHLGWDYVGGHYDSLKITKGIGIFQYGQQEFITLTDLGRREQFESYLETGIRVGRKRLELKE